MRTEFQALRGQLDVFLQAAASKIDVFDRHHEPQLPLESFSDLKLSIEEISTDHKSQIGLG